MYYCGYVESCKCQLNRRSAFAQIVNCNSLSTLMANAVSLPSTVCLFGISNMKTNSILENYTNSLWMFLLISVFC